MITDGERPVALAAIMGGLESEVSDGTTEVLLEAANFEPIGVLRTSERLALRTEGSNKWEKGVDPYAAEPAAVLASRLLVDLAGAEPTGSVDVHAGLPERPVVSFRPERASRLIGLDVVPEDEQRAILDGLGFDVDESWNVTVPTWRARDVTREIDVVEEVARVVLDRVPTTMPLRRSVAGHLTPEQRFRPGRRGRARRCGLLRGVHLEPHADRPRPRRAPPPGADERRARGAADHAAPRPGRGGASQRRRGQRRHPAVRACAGLPPVRRAAPGGAVARRPGSPGGGFEARAGGGRGDLRGVPLPLERAPVGARAPPSRQGEPQTDAGWLGELHPALLDGEMGRSSSSTSRA